MQLHISIVLLDHEMYDGKKFDLSPSLVVCYIEASLYPPVTHHRTPCQFQGSTKPAAAQEKLL